MAANYVLLDKITVGSGGAASVTFSSIPQTYTDLVLLYSARSATSGAGWDDVNVGFNGQSANTSVTIRNLYGYGSTIGSNSFNGGSFGTIPKSANTASTFSTESIYIPNYRSSNFKSWSADTASLNNTSADSIVSFPAGLWSNTAAITSITLSLASGTNIVQYSNFYLYGVVNASTAATKKATGGDIITTSGGYTYHAFLTSGTFTPSQALTCDYLVVAGGGGGGGSYGGGGGAGGLRSTVGATGGGGSLESALSLSSGVGYTVTIGAGGSGGSNGALSTSGSNSVFSTITSTGGGKGADNSSAGFTAGATGGSGGGASYTFTTGGSGTTNQGYAAGSGNGSVSAGSGGGGAGAVSGNVGATNGIATNGGAGVAISAFANATTTGVSNFYAGGGGGGATVGGGAGTYAGTGGAGGGGAGSLVAGGNGTSGTANTGGGGGGSGYITPSGVGGNGGSGIVIVRYAV
jgi:hypothetical protein